MFLFLLIPTVAVSIMVGPLGTEHLKSPQDVFDMKVTSMFLWNHLEGVLYPTCYSFLSKRDLPWMMELHSRNLIHLNLSSN